ncbi:MAG: class I SAM-dependent methyltransferase, partial [Candidatus Moraniibacteriota bacterium]
MSRNIWELPSNVVQPENKPSEILPFLADQDRKRFEQATGHEMAPKAFNVWVVQTQMSQHTGVPVSDAETLRSSLNPTDRSADQRFNAVTVLPQHELRHALPNAFPRYGEVQANTLPDLVVVSGDAAGYIDSEPESAYGRSLLGSETQTVRDIRKAAESALYHHFPSGERLDGDWEEEFLHLHALGNAYASLSLEKHEITDELVARYIASCLFDNSNHDWQLSGKAFDEYVRTSDDSKLRRVVTPGRIRHAIARYGKFSPTRELERFRQDTLGDADPNGFTDQADYLAYHRSLAEAVQKFSQATASNETARIETIFTALKKIIDERKDEYLRDVESEAAEERLLQPLIVAVGKSRRYQDAMLEAGADAALAELSSDDLRELVTLAKRIRTSPASVATERLRRNKSEFYASVVDQIENRSEQTSDTEKELALLKSLFEKIGAKKLLDVGSGYGRLAKPLAEAGFDVTGIDASPTLLKRAKETREKIKNLHYAKGDIIDYRGTVEKGNYDAVYYGWHSFLEAYGLGNALTSLRSAHEALRAGGTIAFDQPARTNPGLGDGWYGDAEHGYMAYLMDEKELQFLLRLAGFEDVHILHWTTKPSELYP